jgi:glutaredoxin
MRRVKVFGLLILLIVVSLLFWTASLRQQRELDSRTVGDFYQKTVNGLNKQSSMGGSKQGPAEDDDEVAKAMAQRLKEAAQVAKDNANAKAPKPDPPSSLVGVGSAAEGASERGVAGRKKVAAGDAQTPVIEETEEDRKVDAELNSILKKSPSKSFRLNVLKIGPPVRRFHFWDFELIETFTVIIFSKSYCPYSKKAKRIFSKYIIDPAPFIVELDQHPLGAQLQNALAVTTSRRTVPNILINGVSIGGGDDVADMDSSETLIEKVKDLGQKKIDIRRRPVESEDESHGLR